MSKWLVWLSLLGIAGVLLFALPGYAQRGSLTGRGTAMGARPHIPFRPGRAGGSLTGRRYRHNPYRRGRSSIAPYLYPYYYYPDEYSDYYSDQAPARPQEPRVVVVENSQPRSETPPPPPPKSLVLELEGNHWVRITSSGQRESGMQPVGQGSGKSSSLRTLTPRENSALESSRELPAAILVFRDGHREKISRYTIVGGTIYTKTDYWSSGSWTKKVPVAELNIPATMEINRERGTNFNLPSGPGEVVVRP